MPTLILNKCLAQQTKPEIIMVPEILPDNWLTDFYGLLAEQLKLTDKPVQEVFSHNTDQSSCPTEKEFFFKELDRHVGKESTYTSKEELLKSLSILYTILKDPKTTDNQRQTIASRIKEDLEKCTPGFHNRVNSIIYFLHIPQNMDELIAKVRFNLVDRVARIFAVKKAHGIHVHNRVMAVARSAGFGVWPINGNDPYLRAQAVAKFLM